MGFGGLLPGSGLSVRTALTNPSTRPGLTLPGRVAVTAGRSPVTVDRLALGLVTRVEPADGSAEYVPVEFHRVPVTGGFGLDADECRTVDFGVPVPWETPVTVVNGVCLLNLRMGLRAEVAVSPMLDRGDLRPVYVHPLPAQEGVLATLTGLGFRLRQVGLLAGRLPGVAQRLPFHQKIGYWAAPLYAGPFSELEVSFFANPLGVEVVFALDRRIALAGAGHVSLSRFRVAHQGAAEVDWTNVVDGWIRYAVDRHGALGSGYPVRTARRPPAPPRSAAVRAEADPLHPGPSGTNTPDSQHPGAEPSGHASGDASAADRGPRQADSGGGGIGGGGDGGGGT
ncbi:sporulation protein [Plantactinospora soyae]|uniref:Sporulation-control protein spo0M n=1 Tax=Plantactinospora soyae TaxID=1544732 RepID=A0A927M7F8_9ACTN|nr:sporulation protein [Plantactinospora soyae]MBE1487986.1 sporulation-control protein spo0M [Plantactinospora soyae]